MTAEMVVMNRTAVALAADSAVTITGPTPNGGKIQKIYANANKLFELVRGQPVGIMIYNSADLVQVPWETLIKIYRMRRRGHAFDRLQDYVDDFVRFLDDNFRQLIPERTREAFTQSTIADITGTLLDTTTRRAQKSVAKGDVPRLNGDIRKRVLEQILAEVEADAQHAPIAHWAHGLTEDLLLARYGEPLLDAVPERSHGLALNKKLRVRVLRAALSFILRGSETPSFTGIVIAGFGELEVFPTCLHFEIGGIIAERLVVSDRNILEVSAERPSVIRPFAQTSEASTFLFGIDPTMKRRIEVWWREWLTERLGPAARRIVAKNFPRADPAKLDEIATKFGQYGEESWHLFAEFMSDLHSKLRYGPIETSAAFLSKGEIASLAENMVDLASLRNRVSIDRDETVGGAVDVAVISPGDGFVWIKRKHYFTLEFNPAWTSRQAAAGVPFSQGSRNGIDASQA